jgi:hypothetical protein
MILICIINYLDLGIILNFIFYIFFLALGPTFIVDMFI